MVNNSSELNNKKKVICFEMHYMMMGFSFFEKPTENIVRYMRIQFERRKKKPINEMNLRYSKTSPLYIQYNIPLQDKQTTNIKRHSFTI